MAFGERLFSLKVWGLALGYFCFYVPYSALLKATAAGQVAGAGGPVSGFRLLPAVVISTAAVLTICVSLMGWWEYAGRRRLLGLSVPLPSQRVLLPGVGTAVIIGATTLCFTFTEVSIVLALVLMRGGVLALAPVVDRLFRRRVRWFSWAALGLSLAALLVALADVNNYRVSGVAALTLAAYLAGYLLRLPFINRLAKSNDDIETRRYFVEEVMVATPLLVALPAAYAFLGGGAVASELRRGFAELFVSGVTLPALLVGALYAGLFCFGTLIYLDCRENSFCIPLNRGSSLLAGVVASYALALLFDQSLPSAGQLGSAGLITVALLLLSPLHHFRRTLGKLDDRLAVFRRTLVSLAAGDARRPATRRLFLFVCSGNTCRSPMAAAIANAEIAARLGVAFEDLETVNVRALSYGVSARAGAPLTPEARRALRSLNVPVGPHAARNLTPELARQAEAIYCMTRAHRAAVIEMIPSAAGKAHCLDPEGDIEDPIGSGIETYLKVAERIRSLVRWRLDEARLSPSL
jgi:protein-tyrosine-phosphatase